jgi:DNA-binding NarL/FixJ family response regulator
MAIDTAPGEGTRVTLSAPLRVRVPEKTATSASPRAASEPTDASHSIDRCRVLLVDDHIIIREGLSTMLELQEGIDVVGQASNAVEAIKLADSLEPDVVIMDVSLGEVSGIEATHSIVSEHPEIKVIGLSMHIEDEIAEAMREAGASAYLTKGGPTNVLVSTIRSLASAIRA